MSAKDNFKYNISFNKPWLNPPGLWVLKIDEIKIDGVLYDKVVIVSCLHNMTNRTTVKARLSPLGNALIVTGPTLPKFLFRQDLTETILALVFKGKADSNMTNKWENVSTTMTQDKLLQTVDLTYKFPNGIPCNNKVFNSNKKGNPPANDFHIVSKFHVFTEKASTEKTGTDIVQSIPFFVWEMAVDNEEQHNHCTKLEQEEEDDDDDLADAFASMAAIKTKSTGT
jgi:hypothetical protein